MVHIVGCSGAKPRVSVDHMANMEMVKRTVPWASGWYPSLRMPTASTSTSALPSSSTSSAAGAFVTTVRESALVDGTFERVCGVAYLSSSRQIAPLQGLPIAPHRHRGSGIGRCRSRILHASCLQVGGIRPIQSTSSGPKSTFRISTA